MPGRFSVIVVDDMAVVRRSMARTLGEEGFRVFEAASPVEAFEILRTTVRPIDLVITDVVMPGMNGVDFARVLQAEWPDTAILFMSAYPAEILVREGMDRPAVHFLAKPFTRDELMSRIGDTLKAMSGKKGQKENGPTSTSPPRPT